MDGLLSISAWLFYGHLKLSRTKVSLLISIPFPNLGGTVKKKKAALETYAGPGPLLKALW